MQPGDLVKLVSVYGGSYHTVIVFHHPNGRTTLPEGTAAVFLGSADPTYDGNPCILVEGRVGWVWPEELEAL
jgi:hypothetical protein